MKNPRTIISLLILVIIILACVVIVQYQDKKEATLPYTIGSAVTPASEMPPGMIMKSFVVTTNEPVPTISLQVLTDPMGGYNVHVITANFTFSPEHVDGLPVAGEGHVHLYIDNELIIMLSDWQHIDALAPGTHVIKVGLFNNDHSAYEMPGTNTDIQASQVITVK